MDQSKSNEKSNAENSNTGKSNTDKIALPKRSFSLEFFVGLFTIAGLVCLGYLAMGLGNFQLLPSNEYEVSAEFDNISGIKSGASVEIAGVQVGTVGAIELKDSIAVIKLRLSNAIKLRDDDIASIRTKGIIGDRYVRISRGASDQIIAPGGKIFETESVVDLEDVIGKIVHSMTEGKETEGKETLSKDTGGKETEGKDKNTENK